ncbi:TPA: hypothetical protein EYO12_00175 [Candidatus Saccharibacteria bacterium]|nr:hypothetical protein [Candidatus Saccharibacteria bacterium]HIO87213.1 hypothetical protein [Candidatus Saccharibacteria bacterium]
MTDEAPQPEIIKKPFKELVLTQVARLINVAMIVAAYLLISNDLFEIALVVFIFSKWRIFFTRPRLWFTNLVNSLCDVTFGLSILRLMELYYPVDEQIAIGLAGVLFIWQLILKPLTSHWAVRLQALLCIVAANTTIWTLYADPDMLHGSLAVLLSIIAAYASGRHVLRQVDSEKIREEIRGKILTVWVFIAAQLAWFFWLWNVYYGLRLFDVYVPQAAIIFGITFSYLGSVLLYQQPEESKPSSRRFMVQQTISYSIIMVAIIVLTNWNTSIQ